MIVTMSTENYLEWLHMMLSSLIKNNPKEDITVFLINCSESSKEELSKEFPKIKIQDHKGEFAIRTKNNADNQKQLVTYLKGTFIHKCVHMSAKEFIWIDATAIIRGSLKEVKNALKSKDVALIRRDFKKEKGKRVFAAEIFGFSKQAKHLIQEYAENCEENKTEWYADQLALCMLPEDRSVYLEFGKYCNFFYEPEALTWSDRGQEGKGHFTHDDVEHTKKMFMEDLERMIPGYPEKHISFMNRLRRARKKKILIFTDDSGWCYHTTANRIAKELEKHFEVTVVNDAKEDRQKLVDWQGDLVWARCNSKRARKMYSIRPELRRITLSSITTGGELLENRTEKQLIDNKGELGIIVQNEEAKLYAEYRLRQDGRKMPVYILANGVDTEMFKFQEERPKEFVVGFAGRILTPKERVQKGLHNYVEPVCDHLGYALKTTTNIDSNTLSHAEMPDFFKGISVLVLPSHSEGCSNTIMEAMSSGVPVVTVQSAWHGENCVHEENILFCRRQLQSVAEELQKLKSNQTLYENIRLNGREFAERHTWGKVAENYVQVFNEAIEYSWNRPEEHVQELKYALIYKGPGSIENKHGVFVQGKEVKVSLKTFRYFQTNFGSDFEFIEGEETR